MTCILCGDTMMETWTDACVESFEVCDACSLLQSGWLQDIQPIEHTSLSQVLFDDAL